jgi:hypothetical protein
MPDTSVPVTRETVITLLNEDLSREEHQINLATALNKNVPILPLKQSPSRWKR